jgi:hypothetical protein
MKWRISCPVAVAKREISKQSGEHRRRAAKEVKDGSPREEYNTASPVKWLLTKTPALG